MNLVNELVARFGSKANIRFGAGTASVKLSASEFREFMQTNKAKEIMQSSRDIRRTQRNIDNLRNAQDRLQTRIIALSKSFATSKCTEIVPSPP